MTVARVAPKRRGVGERGPRQGRSLKSEPTLARTERARATRMRRSGDDRRYLVFDVGGTTTRAALYDRAADRITAMVRQPTRSRWSDSDASGDALIDDLLDALRQTGRAVASDGTPAVVSIGMPGPIDAAGTVLALPTIIGDDAQAARELGA